jgi:translocation and assembly module TamA
MLGSPTRREARDACATSRTLVRSLLLGSALALLPSTALAQQPALEATQTTCPSVSSQVATPPPADADLPAVEPIICDDELAREVPPISAETDSELDRPLESVAEFEQRLGEQPASADPELAAPLPPLEQFDVREVELAEPEPTVEAPTLRYAVRVEGLDQADSATDAALNSQFRELSALEDADGKAANEAMLSARLEEDSKLLQRMLHAYQATEMPVIIFGNITIVVYRHIT